MERIVKILIGCCFGMLFLSLILSLREQTLTGKLVIIKTGLSISSILALLAAIFLTISLAARVGIERAEWYSSALEEAQKLAEKILRKYPNPTGRKDIGEFALKKATSIAMELAEEFNTSYKPIRAVISYNLMGISSGLKSAINAYMRKK